MLGLYALTAGVGGAGSAASSPPVLRSTWRRMSFIGSTERTRGMTSKLLTGGGELVNHSSVFARHGSGPALAPRLSEMTTLTTVTSTPSARMNEPTVESRL